MWQLVIRDIKITIIHIATVETIIWLSGEFFVIRQTQTGLNLQLLTLYYLLFQENQKAEQANTQSKGWKQKLLVKVGVNTNSESLKWITGTDGKCGDWGIVWDFVQKISKCKESQGEREEIILFWKERRQNKFSMERQVVLFLLITDTLPISSLVKWR